MKTAQIIYITSFYYIDEIPYLKIYMYISNNNTKNIDLYKYIGAKEEYIGKYQLNIISSHIAYILVKHTDAGYDDTKTNPFSIKENTKGKSYPKSNKRLVHETIESQGLGGVYNIEYSPSKYSISTLIVDYSVSKKVPSYKIKGFLKNNKFTDYLPDKGTQAYLPIDIFKIHNKLSFAPILPTTQFTDPETGEITVTDWNDVVRNYLGEHPDEF